MAELRAPAREAELVQRLAQEYRDAGYTVTVTPDREQIPRSFPFPPDIVATRENERIAVEVSGSQGSEPSRGRWSEMSVAAEREGWRFRLVVMGPDDSAVDYSISASAEIESRLERAGSLAASDPDAALLLAWSAFEAAARRALLRERSAPRGTHTVALVKNLVHHGLLEGDELPRLRQIAELRNKLAHGSAAPGASPADVGYLVDVGRSLLNQAA